MYPPPLAVSLLLIASLVVASPTERFVDANKDEIFESPFKRHTIEGIFGDDMRKSIINEVTEPPPVSTTVDALEEMTSILEQQVYEYFQSLRSSRGDDSTPGNSIAPTAVIEEPIDLKVTEAPVIETTAATIEAAILRLAQLEKELEHSRSIIADLEGPDLPSNTASAATLVKLTDLKFTEAPVAETTTDTVDAASLRLKQLEKELENIQSVVDYLRPLEVSTYTTSTAALDKPTELKMRLCTCYEADECRQRSEEDVDNCINSCSQHLQSYGENTTSYLNCFSNNKAAIIEAERCLFVDKTEYCNIGYYPRYIKHTNWTDLGKIEYESVADKSIAKTGWKRHEPAYTKIQQFFHCTKHCMHKRIDACATTRGCAVNMPDRDDLDFKMRQCTKKNYHISNALYSACRCLAWESGVTELKRSCVFIGNQYYIDRA